MSFLWPYGLFALLGVPAAIAVALWRARRRDVTVPSLLLWQRLAERMAGSGRKHRKVVDASLVLAAVFALLLALAAAGPMLVRAAQPGRTLLLIVDRSASMQMKQLGTTRWEIARGELGKLLACLTPADRIYLAASPPGKQARIGPLTPAEAAARLDDLRPTDRPADLAQDAARALASAHALGPCQVAVCTDTPEAVPPGRQPIAAIGVGGAAANVFFTRFGYSASGATDAAPARCRVLLGVMNAGPVREISLGLAADGRELESRPLRLDAGAERGELFDSAALQNARYITARIVADDSLAADNVFYAVRSSEQRARVLLVGEENRFIETALAIHPRVEVVRGAEPKQDGGGWALVIYNGVTPARVPAGLAVVINPPQSFGRMKVGGMIENPKVSAAPRSIVADTDLATAAIKTARRIQTAASVLAAADQGPLVIEDGSLICLAFAVDRANTDWMLKPGFPIFWAKVLERVAAADRPGFEWQAMNRGVSVQPAQPGAMVRRISPEESEPHRAAEPFFFDPDYSGLYECSGGGQTSLLAFNFMDAGESSTRGSVRPFDRAMVREKAPEAEAGSHAATEFPLVCVVLAVGVATAFGHWCLKK